MILRSTMLACAMLLLLAGCRQTNEPNDAANINVAVAVEPDAPTVGDATLLVTVTDGADQPINDATISVRGDMSHAGMVPVIREVSEARDDMGVYEVPFEWTMGGDWFVDFTVTLPDGSSETQRYEYTVSGASTMPDMQMNGDNDGEMQMNDAD